MTRPYSSRSGSIVKHFDELRQDYAAAKPSRYKRVRTGIARGGSHADYHIRNDHHYLAMMEDARDMDRCDVLIGHMLNTSATITLMGGIEVQPQTGDEKLDKALALEFWEWGSEPDRCDAAGELCFAEKQRAAFRQSQLDGDIWCLLTDDGRIQDVEAHRVRTPRRTERNVVHGVLLDNDRRRREIWVTKEDIDPQKPLDRVGDTVQYPIRDSQTGDRVVLQVYDPTRASQTRGVTALAPIFDTAGQFEDIQLSELIRRQAVSCTTIVRNRGPSWTPSVDSQFGLGTTTTRSDGSTKRTEQFGPGAVLESDPDETIGVMPSGVPGAEYFPHMKMTIQLISINLGVPLIVLLMDASETNFSGWRGAFDIGKMHWRRNQNRFCTQYVSPVWKWRVRHALADSPALMRMAERLADPKTLFHHVCHKPVWPYIQPLQDATTDLLRMRNEHTSPQRWHASQNQDADEIRSECLTFKSAAIEAAIQKSNEINKRYPDINPLTTWRDFYAAPPPDGINISVNASPVPEGNSGGGKPNAA